MLREKKRVCFLSMNVFILRTTLSKLCCVYVIYIVEINFKHHIVLPLIPYLSTSRLCLKESVLHTMSLPTTRTTVRRYTSKRLEIGVRIRSSW